jgi:hypothetical protein
LVTYKFTVDKFGQALVSKFVSPFSNGKINLFGSGYAGLGANHGKKAHQLEQDPLSGL